MPGRDGIGVLRELRRPGAPPIPVIVVSAFSPAHGARAVDALVRGRVRPRRQAGRGGDARAASSRELADKVRAAAGSMRRRIAAAARRRRARRARRAAARPRRRVRRAGRSAAPARPARRAVAGRGHQAARLHRVVDRRARRARPARARSCPRRSAPARVIVQHMPPGFTTSLAARLDQASQLNVVEAAARRDALARQGRPRPRAACTCASTPSAASCCPRRPRSAACARAPTSASRTPRRLFGRRLLLVVLTGMGNDGVRGAEAVRAHGGRVLVQEESTCTVYGMPRAVAEAGLADGVHGLDELPAAIAARGRAVSAFAAPAPRAAARRVHRLLRGGPPPLLDRPPAVQARPDGAPHPHVRHDARPRRLAAVPVASCARDREELDALPRPRHDQRLAALAPPRAVRGPRRATCCPSWRRRGRDPRLERRLLVRRRGLHARRRLRDRASRGRTSRSPAPTSTPHGRARRDRRLHRRRRPQRRRRRHGAAGSRSARRHAARPCRSCARMCRFEVGDLLRVRPRPRGLRPRDVPQHRHLLQRRGARRAARPPRRRRCAPGGYLVVGATERVADPAGIGLVPTHPFTYRKI